MNIMHSNEILEKNNIAGFILKPDASDIKDIYLDIKKMFEDHGIKVLLEKTSADTLDIVDGIEFNDLCLQSDFLVTLGGDGTLISATRRSFQYQKAVMGINLGTLGFLTDIMPDEINAFLERFKKDDYRIDRRMMIKATVQGKEVVAFNDVVISKNVVSGMVNLDAKIENKLFNKYHGDGLIVSTPTGSTAYNLSCNGPVVFPLTEAFIVTPISAHSLTQRPLVLPVDFKITLENTDKQKAMVIIDGHDVYDLEPNEVITIEVASAKAQLIHRCERNYFDVLNKKLYWGAN
ncbi:NAD(+) kinase [Arcobacter sp. 15-2]|uniref:NAD(+)/NADH kinase n=1 Tax=Arcobacter sp. 15-2 TaxID=3374109 RepID=UPI00399D41C0